MSAAVKLGGRLCGTVAAQPSKSMAHRAILCAAISDGESRVSPISDSQDIAATLRCIQTLGAKVKKEGNALRIAGISERKAQATLPCGESGTTLRFLLPLAPLLCTEAVFLRNAGLAKRPAEPLLGLLKSKGVRVKEDGATLALAGGYAAGDFALPGDVSSQFVSGLLLALPLLCGDSRILLTTPLESGSYVELTRRCLTRFGVASEPVESGWRVAGNQRYRACDCPIEGDWSHAAFFAVAGALYGSVCVTGLAENSAQGDRAIVHLLRRMGAKISLQSGVLRAEQGRLRGAALDMRDAPDLLPPLCIAALAAEGETVFTGAARLRLKESDRLAALCKELQKLGGQVRQTPDGLIVRGGQALHPAACDAHNDHRVAMALAIAAGLCGGLELRGADCVKKSAPQFFEEYQALGGQYESVGG